MESFGAVENVDPSSAEESRAKEILHSTTFHDKKVRVGKVVARTRHRVAEQLLCRSRSTEVPRKSPGQGRRPAGKVRSDDQR